MPSNLLPQRVEFENTRACPDQLALTLGEVKSLFDPLVGHAAEPELLRERATTE
jgi:hypothetical protein